MRESGPEAQERAGPALSVRAAPAGLFAPWREMG